MSTESSRTPEGHPHRCPVCGKALGIEPSEPPGDATCPHCGQLLRFGRGAGDAVVGYLDDWALVVDLKSSTKDDAIRELVGHLVAVGLVDAAQVKSCVEAILRREALGATGIGNKSALPHANHPSVPRVIGALGRSPAGIVWGGLTDEPAHWIFVMLSPVNQPGAHLRALERVSRLLRHLTSP